MLAPVARICNRDLAQTPPHLDGRHNGLRRLGLTTQCWTVLLMGKGIQLAEKKGHSRLPAESRY
jgi:hypothetical protein